MTSKIESHVSGHALHNVCWCRKDSLQLHHIERRYPFCILSRSLIADFTAGDSCVGTEQTKLKTKQSIYLIALENEFMMRVWNSYLHEVRVRWHITAIVQRAGSKSLSRSTVILGSTFICNWNLFCNSQFCVL